MQHVFPPPEFVRFGLVLPFGLSSYEKHLLLAALNPRDSSRATSGFGTNG